MSVSLGLALAASWVVVGPQQATGPACNRTKPAFEKAVAAILAAPPPTLSPTASQQHWDGRSPLADLERVRQRFNLNAAELSLLHGQGAVVPTRFGDETYTQALWQIHRAELPLYISMDAILHSVYRSNDGLIAALERDLLRPRLKEVLQKMRASLAKVGAGYPADAVQDVDVYLSVAEALLNERKVSTTIAQANRSVAQQLVTQALTASGIQEARLFGQVRRIDFSRFKPRGHYALEAVRHSYGLNDARYEGTSEPLHLAPYFRAATWLSLIEFRLASPDEKESAPREVVDALVLADLATRAGVLEQLEMLDRVWTLLAGHREDVSIPRLAEVRQKAGVEGFDLPQCHSKLAAALGQELRRRTWVTGYEGVTAES